jgi:hypothetical protein
MYAMTAGTQNPAFLEFRENHLPAPSVRNHPGNLRDFMIQIQSNGILVVTADLTSAFKLVSSNTLTVLA